MEFSQLYYVVSEEEGWVQVELTATGPVATSYTVEVTTNSGSAHSKQNQHVQHTQRVQQQSSGTV